MSRFETQTFWPKIFRDREVLLWLAALPLAAVCFVNVSSSGTQPPSVGQTKPVAAVADYQVALVAKANDTDWARFRGPTGMGKSDATGLPLNWSQTENIAWKTKLPGAGASSPIVFGDHI